MIAFVLGDMARGTLSRCSSGILRTWHATAYLARILAGVVSVAKLLFVSLLSALSAFSEVAETAAMCTMCHGLLRCSSAAVGVVTTTTKTTAYFKSRTTSVSLVISLPLFIGIS